MPIGACRTKGYADTQAAVPAPAAIEGWARPDCTIERCTIAHSGRIRRLVRARLQAQPGAAPANCTTWAAAASSSASRSQFPDDAEQNYENVVADNHIHDLGLVYAPAVGVWVLQSGRNQIVHNHIHDLYYTAISVGWTWGYGENQSKGNVIEYNHLHDIGKEMLSDMGGIYTLGVQPGTRIRNNLIHDIASFTYGGWGIYPDEGSTEMLIENNIVYHCKSAGFHQHYGRENIVRNNILAFNRENQLMRTRAEPHLSFTFERNIVYFDQGRLLGSNWTRRPVHHERQSLLRYARPGHSLRRASRSRSGRRRGTRPGSVDRRPAVRERRAISISACARVRPR